MVRKIIIAMVFIFILFINLASAQTLLSISPNPISVTLNSSTLETRNINLTNNHDFTIFNITFQDYPELDFPPISQILSGQKITIPINMITNNQETKTINSKVSYFYNTDVSQDPNTYEIIITDSQFAPTSIKIRKNDIIEFKNLGSISHKIVNAELGLSKLISKNSVFDYPFPSTGNFTIEDEDWGFELDVEVKSNIEQEYVHNPDFDTIFTVNLNSLFQQTNISFEFLDNANYTLDNEQSTDGVLRVKNNGNEIADNVHLEADKWITFNTNDFDISPNSNKLVIYTLKPEAVSKPETDKKHEIEIRIKGTNTQELIDYISVFVNLDDTLPVEDFSELDFDEILDRLAEYIKQIRILNQTVNNQTGNITITLTQEQANQFAKGYIDLRDKFSDEGVYSLLLSGLREDFVSLKNELQGTNKNTTEFQNQTLAYQKKRDTDFRNIIISLIGVLIISVSLGYYYYHKRVSKNKMNKNLTYSRERKFK